MRKKININTDSKQMQKTSVHVSDYVCGLPNQANSTCLPSSVHFLFYKLLVIRTAASYIATWTMETDTGKSNQAKQGDFSTPIDGFLNAEMTIAFYATLDAYHLVCVQ